MTDLPRDASVALSLDNVCLAFLRRKGLFSLDEQWVLRDISLQLRVGETLGVIGRNGCGKSTLLRVMAGILSATRGELYFKAGLSNALLALGLGFRGDLTGRDNALLGAMLQGSTRKEALALLPQIREFAELGSAFERPVSSYSSGMRSRLGFATAVKNRVDLLFIDEILAVGDGAFREKAAGALKEQILGQQTVVLVSHNLNEVTALCDRALWVDEGRVRDEGPVEDVVENYRAFLRDAG